VRAISPAWLGAWLALIVDDFNVGRRGVEVLSEF
jgi:hypothetical protein